MTPIMEQSFGPISKSGGESTDGQYYSSEFNQLLNKILIILNNLWFDFVCRNNVENNTRRNNRIFQGRKWVDRNRWYNECGKISHHIQSNDQNSTFFLPFLKVWLIRCCYYWWFQIKTTSPEKFRVRPSTGILAAGNSTTINVVLQSGPNVTLLLNKDKFLVMCMEMSDLNLSQHEIADLWKVRIHYWKQ